MLGVTILGMCRLHATVITPPRIPSTRQNGAPFGQMRSDELSNVDSALSHPSRRHTLDTCRLEVRAIRYLRGFKFTSVPTGQVTHG
jgi:hypothetical protein